MFSQPEARGRTPLPVPRAATQQVPPCLPQTDPALTQTPDRLLPCGSARKVGWLSHLVAVRAGEYARGRCCSIGPSAPLHFAFYDSQAVGRGGLITVARRPSRERRPLDASRTARGPRQARPDVAGLVPRRERAVAVALRVPDEVGGREVARPEARRRRGAQAWRRRRRPAPVDATLAELVAEYLGQHNAKANHPPHLAARLRYALEGPALDGAGGFKAVRVDA